MKRYILTTSVFALFVFGAFKMQAKENKTITIAAASDLQFALDSIISIYKLEHPKAEINPIYGSSGKLFEQIQNNAPFDIFFSADINYPKMLEKNKLTSSAIKTYGIGRIVIWSKKSNPKLKQMKSLLDSSITKIAIANPNHAPYGKRAIESLKYYNLYNKTKNKFVYGESISQTAQYISLGAADMGIIALSLALSPNMQKEKGNFFLIPSKSHTKLKQGCVILKKSKDNIESKSFFKFISSVESIKILKHFGFTL